MFRTKSNPANNVDECVEPGKVSEELWSWSESVEKWGGVLCGLIIASGIINAFYLFFEVHDDFAIFLTQIVSCVFYAFIEYLIYRTIALLISALATITENTRATARLKEYELRKAEGLLSKEFKAPAANHIKGAWYCKNCGTKNEEHSIMCKDCGEYK